MDVGRDHRLVTKAIRAALTQRDKGCAFPLCDAPASACEAHHIRPWWAGGRTSIDNMVLLCPTITGSWSPTHTGRPTTSGWCGSTRTTSSRVPPTDHGRPRPDSPTTPQAQAPGSSLPSPTPEPPRGTGSSCAHPPGSPDSG
nr:HNH endonuclease signature motif containing protein [Tessaracoccus coleopterorum]